MCVSGGRLCGLRKQLLRARAGRGEGRMRSDLLSWTEVCTSPSPVSHRAAFSTNPTVVSLKPCLRRKDRWALGVGHLNPLTWDSPWEQRLLQSVLGLNLNKGTAFLSKRLS